MEPLLLSIQDATRVLGVGRSKLYQLIEEGILDTKTIGRRRLVTMASLKGVANGGPSRLMQHGLIDISAEGTWQERRAREYRLTFVSTLDAHGRHVRATNDYVAWRPCPKSGAERVSADSAFVADAGQQLAVPLADHALPRSTHICQVLGPKLLNLSHHLYITIPGALHTRSNALEVC
jgi:excisionase family DNA binding protein